MAKIERRLVSLALSSSGHGVSEDAERERPGDTSVHYPCRFCEPHRAGPWCIC